MSAPKTVYLLRHAPGVRNAFSPDHDPPLSGRGMRRASTLGLRMAMRGWNPQQIIASPALRALETARRVGACLDHRPETIDVDHRLSRRGCRTLLALLRGLPEEAPRRNLPEELSSVMLVGHHPALSTLLNVLCNTHVEAMPPCALAVVKCNVARWTEVTDGVGCLRTYVFPKRKNTIAAV